MAKDHLEKWLRKYGEAWASRDPEAASSLFTVDARYYETPFTEPAIGRDGVRAYWVEVTSKQRDVRFSHEVIGSLKHMGIARWSAQYTRHPAGGTKRLDGIFLLWFDRQGLCRELREWWHASSK